MHWHHWLLIGYLYLGCVYWLWLAVGAVRVVRSVPVLARQRSAEPDVWPTLSVIVTACNEEDTIEAAARSILAQDYPALELVLIDDRSQDGTGAIVDALAAVDERITPVHIEHLPEGWLGKVHALDRGVEHAAGKLLLFMDADVHLSPGALRQAVAFFEAQRLDHLPVAPEMWSASLWVDTAVSMFLRTFPVTVRAWRVEDPRCSAHAGVGAFNLVRREALERTEGFAWLRMEVVDDFGLGLLLKRHGGRTRLANGVGLLGLYWYRSLREMAHGTEKAFASLSNCSLPRLLRVCLALSLVELAPWIALLPWNVPGLMPARIAMLGSLVFCVLVLHPWSRRPILPGLLTPVALAVNLGLLLRSGWLGWWRGGIVWRGTFYPAAVLREGRRVRIA